MSQRTDTEQSQACVTAPRKDGNTIARPSSVSPLLPARASPSFQNAVAENSGRRADTDDVSVGSNDCLT
eukprot:1261821-Pyramimonas_sp.AAC.2